MRTQLKYVIIPTTAVTVSFIHEGYHYNLKHNLFTRKHPFSAPIQPLKTSGYSPHPILSRCMTARGGSLYLIIIIYLIIYISARVTDIGARVTDIGARVTDIGARVTYIGARRGAGSCTDTTMRVRDARAAGRPAVARTRRAEGRSGLNTAKNREAVWVFQILCLPLPDAEVAPAPANAISKSVEVPTAAVRQLCRRLGLCARATRTMHHGCWDYAPWSLGLCARSPGLCTMEAGTMRQVAGSKNKGQKIYII